MGLTADVRWGQLACCRSSPTWSCFCTWYMRAGPRRGAHKGQPAPNGADVHSWKRCTARAHKPSGARWVLRAPADSACFAACPFPEGAPGGAIVIAAWALQKPALLGISPAVPLALDICALLSLRAPQSPTNCLRLTLHALHTRWPERAGTCQEGVGVGACNTRYTRHIWQVVPLEQFCESLTARIGQEGRK